jgi:hypothetical protein
MIHKQKCVQNFVATPFLGGSFLSYATQAKVFTKFCSNTIFWRKFFSYVTHGKVWTGRCTNFIFERIFFLMLHKPSWPKIYFEAKFEGNP